MPRLPVTYTFPAYSTTMPMVESEVRLVRTLCGELTYPPETEAASKFTWVKTMSDEHNFEQLRLFLLSHRPLKNRRGKKPTGIENFPMVFDLWAASFIESSQFRRICKYSNIHVEQYQEDAHEEGNEDGEEDDMASAEMGPEHYTAVHAEMAPHHGGGHLEHSHLQALPPSADLNASESLELHSAT